MGSPTRQESWTIERKAAAHAGATKSRSSIEACRHDPPKSGANLSQPSRETELTQLLHRVGQGDNAAEEQLLAMTYEELREIARSLMHRESAAHTLQPTALLHEAVLRFFKQADPTQIPNRAYFFGAMARAMRQILVDHARRRNAQKRGAERQRVPLDDTLQYAEEASGFDLLALDESLTKLESKDQRTAQVVMLRCFAGLEIKEIAAQLSISTATVDREWRFARAWLRKEMSGES